MAFKQVDRKPLATWMWAMAMHRGAPKMTRVRKIMTTLAVTPRGNHENISPESTSQSCFSFDSSWTHLGFRSNLLSLSHRCRPQTTHWPGEDPASHLRMSLLSQPFPHNINQSTCPFWTYGLLYHWQYLCSTGASFQGLTRPCRVYTCSVCVCVCVCVLSCFRRI